MASRKQKPISLVLLLPLTGYVSASEASGKKEFRSTAFKFFPGTLRSLSINGLGDEVRARRTYKEKVASKPCGKKTQGIKTVDPSNYVFLCPHNVSKYCHRVPGMAQRSTLEKGVLSWASSKLLAN